LDWEENVMPEETKSFNKNILIAVDESENSRRAVSYVAQLLGSVKGFKVAIVHVVPEAEEDYFATVNEKQAWLDQHRKKADAMLEDYRQILIHGGFGQDDVSVRMALRHCPSMAECILAEREKSAYHTLVVGKQGISRSEEFLFGSVSSKIVNHAKNCTVWVVE
jgi:nucleotide-binding universal stress UspA family protein